MFQVPSLTDKMAVCVAVTIHLQRTFYSLFARKEKISVFLHFRHCHDRRQPDSRLPQSDDRSRYCRRPRGTFGNRARRHDGTHSATSCLVAWKRSHHRPWRTGPRALPAKHLRRNCQAAETIDTATYEEKSQRLAGFFFLKFPRHISVREIIRLTEDIENRPWRLRNKVWLFDHHDTSGGGGAYLYQVYTRGGDVEYRCLVAGLLDGLNAACSVV